MADHDCTEAEVTIEGIEVFAYHGCTEAEKAEGQLFLIDIRFHYNCFQAATNDDLGNAVNYDEAAVVAYRIAEEQRYDLIESLASSIAEGILLEYSQIYEVEVTVHKRFAPMSIKVSEVSVSLKKDRR